MSLSGGLIPLGGQEKSSSSLADMEPLASLERTKSSSVKGGFDDLDDLLNAPSRPSMKKSKNKSKGKGNKKSSSKKKFNVDDSGDFDSPSSGRGVPQSPLSPNMGDSFDHDMFSGGMEPPRGTGAADLDDSILGGLLGGPSKPTRGVTRAKTSGDILGSKSTNPKNSSAPAFSTHRPNESLVDRETANSATSVGKYDAGDDYDDLLAAQSETLNPSTNQSASTIAGNRPSMNRFQSVPSNLGGGRNDDNDRPATTGANAAAGPRPIMSKHSSIKGLGIDKDDLSLDWDIDSLLPNNSQREEVHRPPTNAGRRRHAKENWTDDTTADSPMKETGSKRDGMIVGDDESASPASRQVTSQKSALVPGSAAKLSGMGGRSMSGKPKSSGSNKWDDEICDDDFDVDALLPDNEPIRPAKNSAASSASVHFSPDINRAPPNEWDPGMGAVDEGRASPEMDFFPTSTHLHRNHTAPPTGAAGGSFHPSGHDSSSSNGGAPERLPTRQPRSRSSSPVVLSARPSTTGGISDSGHDSPTKETASGGETTATLPKKGGDDDVDIGFMPSFLDRDSEPPRRRHLGKAKSTRGRINGNNFSDGGDKELDALDKALGIGGDLGGGITPRTGGRVVKAIDPFGHADSVLDKKIHRPSSEQIHRSDATTARSHHIVDKPVDEANISSHKAGEHVATAPLSTHSGLQDIGGHSKSPHDSSDTVAPAMAHDKRSSPTKSSHTSLTSLPALTPHKPEGGASSADSSSAATSAQNSVPATGGEAYTDGRDMAPSRTTHRRHSGGSQDHTLTVRVDLPSDAPMSNPPTVTTVISPQSVQKRPLSSASASSPTVVAESSATTARSGSVGSASGRESRDVSSRSDEHGGRHILRKATSSFELSPTPLPGGRPHSSHDWYTDRSPSPTKRDQRMPSWLSPPGNMEISTGGTSSVTRDATIQKLQQKVDELSVQKDTIEKYLRLEIDTLKNQLEHSLSGGHHLESSTGSLGGGGSGGVLSGRAHATHNDVDDLRQRVRELTKENIELKEESMVEKIRQQKELTQLREKHQADIAAGNSSRSDEITLLERRHGEAINALKKIHVDEIAAVKQRARDGVALEQLSSQITSTTGSLKLIEEQMSLQYRGIDAVREGQFEARERLLVDMEAKARERAEAAEMEGFKLKGLLSHMEQVVENVRSQSGEERERLRMEHRRLEAMYSNLEAERMALQDRTTEELTDMKRKVALAEEKAHADMKHRAEQQAELNEIRRKLEADKKEFAVYVSTNVKSAEHSAEQLKLEEERLGQLRAEIVREKAILAKNKEEALKDLRSAETFRAQISKAREEIQMEKRELKQVASELQSMSDSLVSQDQELQERELTLRAREEAVRKEQERAESMHKSAMRKEQELITSLQQSECQQVAIKEMEDDFNRRKLALVSQRRELTRLQTDADRRNLQTSITLRDADGGTGGYGRDRMQAGEHIQMDYGGASNSSEKNKENIGIGGDPGRGDSSGDGKHSPIEVQRSSWRGRGTSSERYSVPVYVEELERMQQQDDTGTLFGIDRLTWETEVASARRTMQVARGGVAKASHSRSRNDGFIRVENEFLSKIRRR